MADTSDKVPESKPFLKSMSRGHLCILTAQSLNAWASVSSPRLKEASTISVPPGTQTDIVKDPPVRPNGGEELRRVPAGVRRLVRVKARGRSDGLEHLSILYHTGDTAGMILEVLTPPLRQVDGMVGHTLADFFM
jgi:hypothetical protein